MCLPLSILSLMLVVPAAPRRGVQVADCPLYHGNIIPVIVETFLEALL